MPIKKRAGKARAQKITPEAVEAFRVAMDTQDTYFGCLRGQGCKSTKPSEHCPTCRRHIDACNVLSLALDLPPWGPLPIEADTDEPPTSRGPLDLYAAAWPRARELRLELERASQ